MIIFVVILLVLLIVSCVGIIYLINRMGEATLEIAKLEGINAGYENHICVLNDTISNRIDEIVALKQELAAEISVEREWRNRLNSVWHEGSMVPVEQFDMRNEDYDICENENLEVKSDDERGVCEPAEAVFEQNEEKSDD